MLDHCFRQDLHLDSDFYGSDLPPPDHVPRIEKRRLARNDLAKRAIPAPCFHPSPKILGVDNSVAALHCREEPGRPAESNQVFVKVHGNEITLLRDPMAVFLPFKEAPKLRE